MTSLRVFFVGGVISYRALFFWLTPWIFVPSLVIAPVFQILLFVYLGRSAGLENDKFFVIGNALQYASIPCLFAMGHTIVGERYWQTLAIVLSTPARRLPIFLGRAMPVVLNGWFVAAFSLVVSVALLRVDVPGSAWLPIVLVTGVAATSCTGLGLVNAALGLRLRSIAVSSNVIFGFLLILCGVSVPLNALPSWMARVGQCLPLTHAIAAVRLLADGAALSRVAPLVATELLIAVVYIGTGAALLGYLESVSRRHATLEIT